MVGEETYYCIVHRLQSGRARQRKTIDEIHSSTENSRSRCANNFFFRLFILFKKKKFSFYIVGFCRSHCLSRDRSFAFRYQPVLHSRFTFGSFRTRARRFATKKGWNREFTRPSPSLYSETSLSTPLSRIRPPVISEKKTNGGLRVNKCIRAWRFDDIERQSSPGIFKFTCRPILYPDNKDNAETTKDSGRDVEINFLLTQLKACPA